MLAAAILAAGESRRMGTPKALLPYRGKTFVEHLLEVARHPRVGATRVILGAHADEIRQKLRTDAASIVVNSDWRQGQLSSIQAAIRSLPEDRTEGLLLCPVDHPLISAALVARLIEDGLVTRTVDQEDRRSATVRLTRKGRDMFLKMAAAHEQWIERMFADLSDHQTADLLRLLTHLRRSIESHPL